METNLIVIALLVVSVIIVGGVLFMRGKATNTAPSPETAPPPEKEPAPKPETAPAARQEVTPAMSITDWGGVFLGCGPMEAVLCLLPVVDEDALGRIPKQAPERFEIEAIIVCNNIEGGFFGTSTIAERFEVDPSRIFLVDSDRPANRLPGDKVADESEDFESLDEGIEVGLIDLEPTEAGLVVTWGSKEHGKRCLIGANLVLDNDLPEVAFVAGSLRPLDDDGEFTLDPSFLDQIYLMLEVIPGNATSFAAALEKMGFAVTTSAGELARLADDLVEAARAEDAEDLDALFEKAEPSDVEAALKALLTETEVFARFAERALERFPDEASLLWLRGVGNVLEKDFDQGEEDFRAALAADPAFGQAHCSLAALLTATERLEEATEAANAALEYLPDDELCAAVAARAANEDGAENEEIDFVLTHHANLILRQTHELIDARQYERAEAVLRRVLEVCPNHVEAARDLGFALGAASRDEEAAAFYEAVIRDNPRAGLLGHDYGDCLIRMSRLEDAAQAFEECLKFEEAGPEPHVSLVNTLCSLGERSRAHQHLEALEAGDHDVDPRILDALRRRVRGA
ncbi:MAG: hypothetical protein ACNA8W_04775 [Bradymonadaceae bacterium]